MAVYILAIIALIGTELGFWDGLVSLVGAIAAFLILIVLVISLIGLGGYYVLDTAQRRM
jgi:hypothetical protein